jgi:hypothetical protein
MLWWISGRTRWPIKKLINERNGQQAESTRQIVELLNKFKVIAGITRRTSSAARSS